MDLRRARSDARRLRAQVARPLLVVLAALALLGTGGWDVQRADAPPVLRASSSSAPSGADSLPPRALELRAALLAAVPAPLSAPDVAPPERGGLDVAAAPAGAAVRALVTLPTGPAPATGSRAPPGEAGTYGPLPTSA